MKITGNNSDKVVECDNALMPERAGVVTTNTIVIMLMTVDSGIVKDTSITRLFSPTICVCIASKTAYKGIEMENDSKTTLA